MAKEHKFLVQVLLVLSIVAWVIHILAYGGLFFLVPNWFESKVFEIIITVVSAIEITLLILIAWFYPDKSNKIIIVFIILAMLCALVAAKYWNYVPIHFPLIAGALMFTVIIAVFLWSRNPIKQPCNEYVFNKESN